MNDGLTSEGISRETGRREYYISDEYGSPVRYTDENRNTTGLYGYDEYRYCWNSPKKYVDKKGL